MKERLIKILKSIPYNHEVVNYDNPLIVEYLINTDVIVPPKELYSIVVNKERMNATVSKAIIDHLPLYKIRNPEKYGYYRTREEAEQKLKDRKEDENGNNIRL